MRIRIQYEIIGNPREPNWMLLLLYQVAPEILSRKLVTLRGGATCMRPLKIFKNILILYINI